MNYRERFRAIHQRPGMWGLDGSYGQFCAFLKGYDEGTSRSLLTGFDEWLRRGLGLTQQSPGRNSEEKRERKTGFATACSAALHGMGKGVGTIYLPEAWWHGPGGP